MEYNKLKGKWLGYKSKSLTCINEIYRKDADIFSIYINYKEFIGLSNAVTMNNPNDKLHFDKNPFCSGMYIEVDPTNFKLNNKDIKLLNDAEVCFNLGQINNYKELLKELEKWKEDCKNKNMENSYNKIFRFHDLI